MPQDPDREVEDPGVASGTVGPACPRLPVRPREWPPHERGAQWAGCPTPLCPFLISSVQDPIKEEGPFRANLHDILELGIIAGRSAGRDEVLYVPPIAAAPRPDVESILIAMSLPLEGRPEVAQITLGREMVDPQGDLPVQTCVRGGRSCARPRTFPRPRPRGETLCGSNGGPVFRRAVRPRSCRCGAIRRTTSACPACDRKQSQYRDADRATDVRCGVAIADFAHDGSVPPRRFRHRGSMGMCVIVSMSNTRIEVKRISFSCR
jgi:hypothetical protein